MDEKENKIFVLKYFFEVCWETKISPLCDFGPYAQLAHKTETGLFFLFASV